MTTNSNDQIMNITYPPPDPLADARLHHILRSFFTTVSPTRNRREDLFTVFMAMDQENRMNFTNEQFQQPLLRVINQNTESLRSDIFSFVDVDDSRRRNVLYRQLLERIHHLDDLMMLREIYLHQSELWSLVMEVENNFLNVDPEVSSAEGGSHEEAIPRKCSIKTRKCGDDDHDHDEVCVVCQDRLFQENGIIVILGCGHEYHDDCIIKWLRVKNICPLCRVDVDGVDIDDDDEGDNGNAGEYSSS